MSFFITDAADVLILSLHQFKSRRFPVPYLLLVEIEIGAMDYGMEIDGIIGLDFLIKVKAKIDLEQLKIYQIFCKAKYISIVLPLNTFGSLLICSFGFW